MRITSNMQLTDALASEARASQQVYDLTQEATSGLQINAPSDNPAGYASIVSGNAQIAILQARTSAITTSSGDLSLAEGALSSAGDLMTQAQQIAITASDGGQSGTDRANAATQINQIVQQLIGLGNTQGASGYIFGGTNTGTPPFDSSGNFSGNTGSTQLEVANGVMTQTNASGADAFTAAGGRNVIDDLQTLATALSNNDVATIQSSLPNLDADSAQVVAARVNADNLASTLQSSNQIISSALVTIQTTVGNEANANVPTVYSELSQAQTSYQSALSVNQQILSMFQTGQSF